MVLNPEILPKTLIAALLILPFWVAAAHSIELPFTSRSPVIYDNDDHRDVYTDEYLLALAAAGRIQLKAFITTYAPNEREYRLFVQGRADIVDRARQSGMTSLPEVLPGTNKKLIRPASNRIEDTQPLQLAASEKIVQEARKTTPEVPLVIITGGQLTAVANACLLDPEIADRVVVSGIFGVDQRDYNAGLDAWAWTIVLARFRVLAIPIGPPGNRGVVYMKPPHVPKARIKNELPQDLPFFQWMCEKRHPTNALPDEHDYDGQAAIPLMRPDYVTGVERWRATGIRPDGRPDVVRDSNGPIYKATEADQSIATEEFWRAMRETAEKLKGQ